MSIIGFEFEMEECLDSTGQASRPAGRPSIHPEQPVPSCSLTQVPN
jgi:hypothetical protein